MKTVELMVRSTCGSCERVEAQIAPVVEKCDTELVLVDVDLDPDNAAQYGDRVPVVVIDEEEFACWVVDNADLEAELLFPTLGVLSFLCCYVRSRSVDDGRSSAFRGGAELRIDPFPSTNSGQRGDGAGDAGVRRDPPDCNKKSSPHSELGSEAG